MSKLSEAVKNHFLDYGPFYTFPITLGIGVAGVIGISYLKFQQEQITETQKPEISAEPHKIKEQSICSDTTDVKTQPSISEPHP
jgi:hypothetical protein